MTTATIQAEHDELHAQLGGATDQQLADHFVNIGSIGMDAGQYERAVKFMRTSGDGKVAFPAGQRAERNRVQSVSVHDIHIKTSRRSLDEAVVGTLMEAIRKVGLLHPPIIVLRDDILVDGEECGSVPVLVAGRHRLEAWRRLGHYRIPCLIADISDLDAELMEISENLHRAELTALQRDEQVSRWIDITKTKQDVETAEKLDAVLRQPDAKPGRPEGGVRAASRALGLSEPDARRAVKVASLSPEAKAAAIEAGLADNRTALLEAARESEPAKQVEAIQSRVTLAQGTRPDADARRERAQRRYDEFMAAIAGIEPLLEELEYSGYEDDNHDGDPVFAYDDLTYMEIAGRYKPVFAIGGEGYLAEGKGAAAAWRRLRNARDVIFQIMCSSAESEEGAPGDVVKARSALDDFLARFAALTDDQRRECLAGRDLSEVSAVYDFKPVAFLKRAS